jgi:hypothetical protein
MNSVDDEAVRAALRRWQPGLDLAAASLTRTDTERGTMITAATGDPARTIGRIFVDERTGTIYEVPTWVSRAAMMDGAVTDPRLRRRLAVI